MPVVRTTIQPDTELEVSEQEATDLRRQGLLVEDEAPAEQPAKADTPTRSGGKLIDKEGN